MRYVVVGDIHGNYYALKAVVNEISQSDNVDGIIFTGDYVGDFPMGDQVVDLMKSLIEKYSVYMIRGNRETGQVVPYISAREKGDEPDWSLETTMGAALVCCRQISIDNLKFLANLPDTLVIRNEGLKPIFIKHKMPLDGEELDLVRTQGMDVLTAHTHEAHIETVDGITLFNSGSVGLSDEGIPGVATYAVIESTLNGGWDFSVRDVPYDTKAIIESLRMCSDLYDRCCGWGKALELSVNSGINCTSLYSFEAKRLAMVILDSMEKNVKPDLSPLSDIRKIFGQGRYGNSNYDGSPLTDTVIESYDGFDVFGKACVTTSDGIAQPKIAISEKTYLQALKNISVYVKMLFNDNAREIVFHGRHGKINM